jgi:hypothetical protein
VRQQAGDLTENHTAHRRQPARHSLHDPPPSGAEITAGSVEKRSSTATINI